MRIIPTVASAVLAIALAGSLAGCDPLGVPGATPVAQPEGGATSTSISARFIRVIDGDTIAVEPTGLLKADSYGEHSVRLLGIDAPEMHKTTNQAPDCGAQAATDHLKVLLAGQSTVTLVFDPVSDHTDRYGRSLAYVEASDHDVNLEQAAGGFAEAWYPYGEPAPGRYSSYSASQKLAEDSGVGSWGACGSLGR